MLKVFNRLKNIKWRYLMIYIFGSLGCNVVFGLCEGHDVEWIIEDFFNAWPHNIAILILATTVYIMASLQRAKEA